METPVRVIRIVALTATLALLAAPSVGASETRPVKLAWIAETQLATWKCQDQLGHARTQASVPPDKLPKSDNYRRWVLNEWKLKAKKCAAALAERKHQWNWQAFPSWIIELARCESSINWFAEGSSSHGLFYSAFNIGRSRYDAAAQKMGVRGWNEGPGVPSPWEQAMAVIGYMRIYGDGFTGNCHGIARSSWN